METRPLDPTIDWPFFDPDERPSDADLSVIRSLTESSARALWDELISAGPAERHPMLLGGSHWLEQLEVASINWREVWNAERTQPDPVAELLDAHLGWEPTDETVFVWMRERAVTAPWETFRRNWRAYLFDDEGPILLSRRLPQVVAFSPSGVIRFGTRPRQC